ncbi:MAG TPA: 50S ribosomal protein L11 methyltransferase [Kouleothrix sp.]|uniref:50S ribosomal protein L11 methyltransferase n=1 Tax=Kouleothrix sp. TaxID=2779161 RepID=UPI002B555096|nr:50S ribosomal protein L11 methyltransferase [Kouleothrix sp.]HRC75340.1 50S ribosomal protein L11 methyltransferase [Kouleothrix sp.]
MTWLELSVDVEPEAVESISELLAQYGYNGGVVIDQPIITGADGPEYTFDTTRPVTMRTYIPLDERAEEARQRLEQALWHFGQMRAIGPLAVRPLEEEDWANAWKQHYAIQRIGQRTVIVPSWLEYQPADDDIVLRLDPGMAFGTGLHPTTQLCIGYLEQYARAGQRALDLGCGSGILAIAAAKLGAHVLALDTDPIAVDATRENVARNDVAGQVAVDEGSLGAGNRMGHWLGWGQEPRTETQAPADPDQLSGFDLIVANIIARVLAALAADLAGALAPGGILISSGIIAEREHEVAEAFAAAGLLQHERRQEGDWVALVHQKERS